MRKFLALFVIGSLLVLSGCSKDDKDDKKSPTGPSDTSDVPTFKIHKIEIPPAMPQSNDQHAQTVVLYMNLANAFGATLNNNFVPPSLNKASGDGPWEYNWKDGDLQVSVVIKKLTEKYTWEVSYNGSDDENVYQNFVAFRAEQGLDERSGKFFAYIANTELVLGQYTWSLDENDTLHFEVIAEAYLPGSKFVGLVNSDRSGTLEIISTIGNTELLQQKYQWDSAGAGEWWEYDQDGNLIGQGTWT